MRIRSSWLAFVLTAGMAWAPAAAWGQDYTPPDPVIPLPLYHDRPETGGFYTYGDFIYYRLNNPLGHQTIAVRGLLDYDGTITQTLNLFNGIIGPRQPGTFIGSGTPALFADDAKNPQSYQPGWNIGLGWKFQNGVSVSAQWLHLAEAKYAGNAGIVNPQFNAGDILQETFLFSPVSNFSNEWAGPGNKLAIGSPFAAYGIWNGASNDEIIFTQRYDQFDLTARIPIYQDDCNRCYGLLGTRMNWLWERFWWRTVALGTIFAPASFENQNINLVLGEATQSDIAVYTNVISQRMYGVHLGSGYERRLSDTPIGTFSVSLDLDAAFLLDVVKEIAKYERGDKFIAAKRARTEYQPVPELSATANILWYPIEGVEVHVGYDFMSFFNTVAAPSPVDFNFNSLNPGYRNGFTRFIDGFHAGIAFIF